MIDGEAYCVSCASEKAPRLVNKRVRQLETQERSQRIADGTMRRWRD